MVLDVLLGSDGGAWSEEVVEDLTDDLVNDDGDTISGSLSLVHVLHAHPVIIIPMASDECDSGNNVES